MALVQRRAPEEKYISAAARDKLLQRKAACLETINQHLQRLEESPFKSELIATRDRIFAKFPTDPIDLSVWMVAYYEDWMRDFQRVPPGYLIDPPTDLTANENLI